MGSIRAVESSDTLHATAAVATGARERDTARQVRAVLTFGEPRPIGTRASLPSSPTRAKLLLRYALPRKHQEPIIGDLEEAYHTEWLPEHGLREARRLYWWHAIRSIAPMLWTGAKRSAIITAVVRTAQWLFGTSGG